MNSNQSLKLILTILPVLACCSKIDAVEPHNPYAGTIEETVGPDGPVGYDTIYAYVSEMPDLKTALSRDDGGVYSIDWSAGDSFTLLAGSVDDGGVTSYSQYIYTSADGSEEFRAYPFPDHARAEVYRAFYPSSCLVELVTDKVFITLPDVQTYAGESFGPACYPMAATAYGPMSEEYDAEQVFPSLSFSPTCGILRVKLKAVEGETVKVASITVTVSGAGLSGRFIFEDGKYVYATESVAGERDSSVTLFSGETNGNGVLLSSTGATPFMIVLPEGTYEGLKLTVRTTDNKLRYYTLKEGKTMTIAAGRFSDMNITASGFSSRYELQSRERAIPFSTMYESYLVEKEEDIHRIFKNDWILDVGSIDDEAEDYTYESAVITYPTTAPDGREVWASGRIYYTTGYTPDHIVLCSHYTIGSNAEAPSVMHTFDCGLAFQHGLVVVPDYLGFGSTREYVHPYLCPEQTAKNALDMVRAARAFIADEGLAVAADAPLYNLGYSQGGGSALAIVKYVQMNNLLSEFPLKNSYCGGGVYSPKTFWENQSKEDYCPYPAGVPMMLMGMKYNYPDIMTFPLESYLSKEVVDAGIPALVLGKTKTVDEITSAICDIFDADDEYDLEIKQILSKNAATVGTDEYNQIMKCLDLEELTTGWQPSTPVHFLHYYYDEIVGYSILRKAEQAFTTDLAAFDVFEYSFLVSLFGNDIECHRGTAGLFYARAICGEYKEIYDKEYFEW